MALTAARAQHVCRRRMLSAAAARALYRCKLRIFCGHFDVRSAWLSMQVAVYTARVRINPDNVYEKAKQILNAKSPDLALFRSVLIVFSR